MSSGKPTRPRASKSRPPNRRPQNNKVKTGARWDDEHKARMQAEMEARAR